ncbi:lysophospholipid acyltransferase family protein [Rouxiella badensis]|jgi:1-acyl-sn-glycerol-3-phosphate acyltransferase|uniref:1-acyl-sn-glycerol-3-phosphate acyltransferase n=1 Tax=Rouxiella badensis TaxID=1646377 RepID=A0A1X0WCT6_9GAMM|nr:lysophospholipid acyltransferase family protein [Rouxiella badensis]MCC3703900.1 1-acyl-sn-glycerol-3-phosphate acyltransferase [Rouxiella badensis]MCC3718921.1 1-acyl-sn-glycerol-3-phosphate acyltransferase [Rouxiella badensis]MCC3728975.1 1-acyl-sn-glycerol-3-phosphate acyltransferase [Rouxiella badensis]MCC3733508.1 1-acyl-sn-glycerol-3-phosphate acyltransferase [Rouxiella badensis]MCC3740526.1 1-acyl-sn-glycerol-3-phosphate acyltransferase [Rouxiella badensis]
MAMEQEGLSADKEIIKPASLINRMWRWLATGLLLILFNIGGLILSLGWFTLLRLFIRNPQRLHQLTLNSIKNSFVLFLSLLRHLRVVDFKIEGAELFKQDKGCLVIANHPSLLDYVLLASCMPRCDCIVKESLLMNPFFRGVIKSAGYLVNSGSETLLDACEERLKAGGTILIFPEGTRSIEGKEITLQRGAANIALRAGCDIRVVYISCRPPMLTKQGRWYSIPPIKPQFLIKVKGKVATRDFIQEGDASPAMAARRLTHHLRTELMLKNNEK